MEDYRYYQLGLNGQFSLSWSKDQLPPTLMVTDQERLKLVHGSFFIQARTSHQLQSTAWSDDAIKAFFSIVLYRSLTLTLTLQQRQPAQSTGPGSLSIVSRPTGVSNRWTGPLDWITGLDYWTRVRMHSTDTVTRYSTWWPPCCTIHHGTHAGSTAKLLRKTRQFFVNYGKRYRYRCGGEVSKVVFVRYLPIDITFDWPLSSQESIERARVSNTQSARNG